MTAPLPAPMERAVESLHASTFELLAPPPRETAAEWADRHYYLSVDGAAGDAGKWTCIGYQRGILEAFSDPLIPVVTVQKSARVGYTKMLCAFLGYRVDRQPCPVLIVQPSLEDAEAFSKEELAPMIRDVPAVAAKFPRPSSRTSANTILRKAYRGGWVKVVGAHSGRGFRRVTVDVVMYDELDGYPPSAGADGDQVALGDKRLTNSAWPKSIRGSTPLHTESSRIIRSHAESDDRRYFVPCPSCDHGQILKWGTRDSEFGIKWDGATRDEILNDPTLVYYLCEQCHERIGEEHKHEIVEHGEWIAQRPEVVGHAGFHIWQAYSSAPQTRWAHLAASFLAAGNHPLRVQVFVNTALGEGYSQTYESLDAAGLMLRRHAFPTNDAGERQVPAEVAVLTAATDVQTSPARLETYVHGWASLEECWHLERHVIYGDPSVPAGAKDSPWDTVAKILTRPRTNERGRELYVAGSAFDMGGHFAQAVIQHTRHRALFVNPDGSISGWFAIKGVGTNGPVWPKEPTMTIIAGGKSPFWPIHVDPCKEQLFSRLALEEPGPGYHHFPPELEIDYFDGLTAEVVHTGFDRAGRPVRKWKRRSEGQPNEPLDGWVYSYAMLCGLRLGGLDLEAAAAAARSETGTAPPASGAPPPTRGRRPISRGVE